jgi:hypothetical protein
MYPIIFCQSCQSLKNAFSIISHSLLQRKDLRFYLKNERVIWVLLTVFIFGSLFAVMHSKQSAWWLLLMGGFSQI